VPPDPAVIEKHREAAKVARIKRKEAIAGGANPSGFRRR